MNWLFRAAWHRPLTAAAAKIRNWGVKDDEADMQQAVWAGVIPLRKEAGEPDAG